MDNYAGGKVPAFPSPLSPNLCNIFTIMRQVVKPTKCEWCFNESLSHV